MSAREQGGNTVAKAIDSRLNRRGAVEVRSN